jgi:hypothetical protein
MQSDDKNLIKWIKMSEDSISSFSSVLSALNIVEIGTQLNNLHQKSLHQPLFFNDCISFFTLRVSKLGSKALGA